MKTWFDRRFAIIGSALLALMAGYFLISPSLAETARVPEGTQTVTRVSYDLQSPLGRHLILASTRCPDRLAIGGRMFGREDMPCAAASGIVLFEGLLPSGTTSVDLFYDVPVTPPQVLAKILSPDLWLTVFLLTSVGLSAFLLMGWAGASASARWLTLILLLAAFSRLSYANATPPWIREHDRDGHVQYIDYLRSHHAIPHALEGWEFHQSPAYYALAAFWADSGKIERLQEQRSLLWLQGLSILLSLSSIPFMLWIGLLLFRRRSSWALLSFLALAALNPSTVFMTSQISNDVLQTLVSFAFFALLLKWWESGTRRDWVVLCVVISLGVLTKMSSLLFLPIAGACLLLRETKALLVLRRIAEGGIITGALSGWLLVRRFLLENDLSRFGKSSGFEGYESMYVGTKLMDYLVFRPWFVLAVPYNSTRQEGFGRRFFWEYSFKSLFIGEWSFGPFVLPLAMIMMFLAMGGILIAAASLWRSPRSERHPAAIPVAVTLVVSLAALAAYRLTGYTCNQDVRYVPLLCIAFAYYLVRGWESLNGAWKTVMRLLIVMLAVVQGIFLLLL